MRPLIRSRFDADSTAADVVAQRDLRDKTIVITGGASGIGLETTRALAAAGADVVVGARNIQTAAQALDGVSQVMILKLDLLDPGSIAEFAAAVLSQRSRLDVLICNAGISFTPQSHTADGLELRFATNHLGHFRLVTALKGALAAAAPSRVVMVSSAAHKYAPVVFDDIHYQRRTFEPFQAYGQSKSANVLFAVEFTRRFSAQGITANALSPGSTLTRLQRHISKEQMIRNGLLDQTGAPVNNLRTNAQGAATTVWAAIEPALDGLGGLYLEDCREAEPFIEGQTHKWYGYAPHARDPENAMRLWHMSEEMIAG